MTTILPVYSTWPFTCDMVSNEMMELLERATVQQLCTPMPRGKSGNGKS
jgi:hypothetical protein